MHVQITQVPSVVTVISLSRASQHPLLRESSGRSWLRICDYLLVEEMADGCKVILVELKSSLQKRLEGLEQLRRSLPIAKYLLSVCEVELQRSWPGQYRYALIAENRTNRLDKPRTRPLPNVEEEDYEGIRVSLNVGTRFKFAALAA